MRFTTADAAKVKPANYHITTFFIGNLAPAQLENVVNACDEFIERAGSALHAFDITLMDIVSWQKPKILAAIPDQTPEVLAKLNKLSQKAAAVARPAITHQHASFRPHVTLYRKVRPEQILAPLVKPSVTFTIKQLHLFESVSGSSGVTYPIRFSWPLAPAFSHRLG